MTFHVKGTPRLGGHGKGNSMRQVEQLWHVCCQSVEEHRFDCAAAAQHKRGAGPCLPVTQPTTAEMIARMRR